MKRVFASIAALAALASSTSAYAVAPVPGDYTFDFSGVCTDCTGFGVAQLKVTNYVPGTSLNGSNFVSFSYAGTNLLEAYVIDGLNSIGGALGLAPASYNFYIDGFDTNAEQVYHFSTLNIGAWSTGRGLLESSDFGSTSTFTSSITPSTSGVPEPGTWAMMLLGFAVVGATMRRKQAAKVSYAF